jgi:nucleoside phosphorylase
LASARHTFDRRCGGIGSDVKVGDVVIASEIIDYERQKLTEAGPQPRWEVFRTDTMLLEAARRTARGKWASQIKIKPPRRTKISCHFGPIASGDKIIASSDQIDILRHGREQSER